MTTVATSATILRGIQFSSERAGAEGEEYVEVAHVVNDQEYGRRDKGSRKFRALRLGVGSTHSTGGRMIDRGQRCGGASSAAD